MKNQAYKDMKGKLVAAARKSKSPIQGHFELTARCNLNCKMCYVHNMDNTVALQRELSTEQWKKIFDEAYNCGLMYASLTGGECLIRKDFKELYLHLWNKRVMVMVLTNGTMLTDEYVDFFKTYRPESVQISLYGSSDEGYLNLAGNTGFQKAVAAIDNLIAAGIDVHVAVVPNKYLMDDYINILRFCKEKNYPLANTDVTLIQNRDNPEKNDYFLTDEETLELMRCRAELYGTELTPMNPTPEHCGPMCEPAPVGLTCNAGSSLAVISWDGKMYPCISIMENGADVLQLGYAEAWKQTVQTAASVVRSAECVGCAYEKTCPKCMVFRLKDLHCGHCNPAVCDLTRKMVAEGLTKFVPVEQGE